MICKECGKDNSPLNKSCRNTSMCSFFGILFLQRPTECKTYSFIKDIKMLERLLKECEKYNQYN